MQHIHTFFVKHLFKAKRYIIRYTVIFSYHEHFLRIFFSIIIPVILKKKV